MNAIPDIGARDLMHASLYRYPFTADGWIFENKLDGFRALVRKAGQTVELLSRNGRAMGAQFPEVVDACKALPDSIIDAELVVLNAEGHACGIEYVGVRSCG